MKFCPKCNEFAFADRPQCARCGTPLADVSGSGKMVGAAGSEAGPSAPETAATPDAADGSSTARSGDSYAQSISGASGVQQLRELVMQTADHKARNVTRSRVLLSICAGVAAAILLTLFAVYYHTVLSFAALKSVKVTRDRRIVNRVNISFRVVRKGKVRLENRSGRFRAEKLDRYAKTGRKSMYWSWSYDPDEGIDFTVRFRRGLYPVVVEKHFRPADFASTVYLVLDVSGSMSGAPLNEMKEAVSCFLQELPLGHGGNAGIVVFGSNTRVLREASGDRQELIQASGALHAGGGTPMDQGIRLATGCMEDQKYGMKCMLLFTDGQPDNQRLTIAAAEEAKDAGIDVWAVGTSGADINLLKQLASSPDTAFFVSPEKLRTVFTQIAQELKATFRTL